MRLALFILAFVVFVLVALDVPIAGLSGLRLTAFGLATLALAHIDRGWL